MSDNKTVFTLDTDQAGSLQTGNTEGPESRTEDAADRREEAVREAPEPVVWEARYSMKNFYGRLLGRTLLTAGWAALAVYMWEKGLRHWQFPVYLLGIALAIAWIALLVRIVQARLGHRYQLTARRLFISSGLFRHRVDQLELLRVKDVFERQGLIDRWLSVGTVVVVSSEPELPTFYLAGVSEPKQVMDLVWRLARAEREGKTVQVENL
jgi:membrane protein YdbS with pleckstrin-like domain